MASSAKKAAMLLSCLDAQTAGELLKAASPEMVKKIVKEINNLGGATDSKQASQDAVREFVDMVDHGPSGASSGFLRQVLQNALGEQKYLEVLDEVQSQAFTRSPFATVKEMPTAAIGMALEGESPQVVALVLSELGSDKSMELLSMLPTETRDMAVQAMTLGSNVSEETRLRVAKVIEKRVKEIEASGADLTGQKMDPKQAQYRKVAVIIRGLGTEQRVKMLDSIKKLDKEAAEGVARMMVMWEDIDDVPSQALAEVLRSVNSKKLALAMVGISERTAERIRSNMSERANAMLDEEADLLASPKPSEIDSAREEIVEALRELNSQGFVF